MKILRKVEFDIESKIHFQITNLRNSCFTDYRVDRSYYKQLPHFRYLVFEENLLIGHMGIDHRVISVADSALTIFGVIDLCIHEDYRQRGIASNLLDSVFELATMSSIDFILLISDKKKLYLSKGFTTISQYCSWMRIDEHKNYGIAFERIENEIMVKQIGRKKWPDGPIDLLGYMF